MKHVRSVLLAIIFVLPFIVKAGIFPVPQGKIFTQDISNPTPVEINQPSAFAEVTMPASANTQFVDRFKQGVITFGVDHHYSQYFSSARIEVKLELMQYTYATDASPFSTTTVDMAISYSPNDSLSFQDKQLITINNIEKYSIRITEIKVNGTPQDILPANLYIHGDLFIDRIYDFEPYMTDDLMPTINASTNNSFLDCDNIQDQIKIQWNVIPGAEEYQLEWTYINDYTENASYKSTNDLTIDFKHNSTRISTTDNHYSLSLTFDHGYICYRVRAIGRTTSDMTKLIFGEWSTPNDVVTVNQTDYYFNQTPFEINKNWQYSSTYAEEGKKKEVVSFFDGSLRNRQMVTKINSDDNAIVGETIYDHQGRPTIQVLPTPVKDPTCTNGAAEVNPLKYYPNFTKDENGEAFNREDFDVNAEDTCNGAAAPKMGDMSGASYYYSTQNTENSEAQGFVPDAEKYPYSQVEYTPDNTGRIRRQGGVGEAFQLGSGHESNYFYSHPFQIQLDRLFGSEVGDASHYQKNMVVDPNGQVSISYLDQEGRVIATSLAGDAPDSLLPLNSAISPEHLVVDLLAKNSQGVSNSNQLTIEQNALLFNQTFSLSAESDVKFKYDLSIDPFKDTCLNNVCFSCVYDLSIEVKDQCGLLRSNPALSNKLSGRFQVNQTTQAVEFKLDCPSGVFTQSEFFEIPNLEIGTYQVTKKLTVNEEALNFYLEKYLDSTLNDCITTLHETNTTYLDDANFTDCEQETDCDACVAALGTLEAFIQSGEGNQQDYEALVSACRQPCQPVSYCETMKDQLLSDMRAGGQYAEYQTTSGVIQPSNFPLSVLNVSNVLPISYGGGGPDATWKNPRLIIDGQTYNEYRNDDLTTRSIVYVDPIFSGAVLTGTNPAITLPVVNTNVWIEAGTGLYYTYPELLANVNDFIDLYLNTPSWAHSMLLYHPEYSYLKTCMEYTVKVNPSDAFTSESFDQKMQSIDTWDGAVAAGFIKPNWASITNPTNRIENLFSTSNAVYDPFGVYYTSITGAGSNEFQAQLAAYQSINGVSYSAVEFAAIMNRCGSAIIGVQPNATCTLFGSDDPSFTAQQNDELRNAEWLLFRSTYLSIKQQLQGKFARERAISDAAYYGYNGCIGNDSFQAMEYNFLNFSVVPFTNSQYFNSKQPCHYSTRAYYLNKQQRFIDPLKAYAQTANEIAYQQYLITGQCPAVNLLEAMLNEIVVTDQLTQPTFNVTNLDMFSGLELALNDFVAQSPLPQVTWNQVSINSQELIAEMLEPTGVYGTMKLSKQIGEPIVFTWTDIVAMSNLNYTTQNAGEYEFTVTAKIQLPTGFVNVTLNGATSLNLAQCRFEDVCSPSEFGQDLNLLLNAIAANNQFTAANYVVQGAGASLNSLVTNPIQLAVSQQATTNMTWSYSQSLPGFMLYETNQTERLEFKINSIDPPTFNLNNMNLVASISELQVGHDNTFSLICNDASGAFLAKLNCDAIYHNGTQKTQVALGDCDLPTPLMCDDVEYQNFDELEALLKDVLENQTIPYNLFTSLNLTPSLEAQLPVGTTTAPGTVLSNDTVNQLTFTIQNACPIELSIEPNQGAGIEFVNITAITDMEVSGSVNNFGSYNSFILWANFDVNGNTVSAKIFGNTCLPIRQCNGCTDLVPLDSLSESDLDSISNRQLQDGLVIEDASASNFLLYKNAIDSLNLSMNWTPQDSNFVVPVSYDYFFRNGISYPISTYIHFINNFEPSIDDHAYLTDPLSFILDYGHSTNVSMEYQRYLSAVAGYNSVRTMMGNSTIVPVSDTTFALTIYPDTLNVYVDYLRNNAMVSTPATTIDAFPTVQAAAIDDGPCKVLYEQYANAYKIFAAQQQINPTCLNFQVESPFVSYDVFVNNNMCCSQDGLAAFQDYINAFSDLTLCPGPVPFKESCTTPVEVNLKDCQKQWVAYKNYVSLFNNSDYAQATGQQMVLLYPNFNTFVQTGKCDCIADYLRYLRPFLLVPDSLIAQMPQTVQTIDQFCPTQELVFEDAPCETAYDNYLDCIAMYNQWAIAHNTKKIERIVKMDEFFNLDLCLCVDAYCSTLNEIMDGFLTPEKLPDLISVCKETTTPPCSPEVPMVDNVEMIEQPFIDPCMEFYTNTAYSNALNTYEQQVQNLTTEFTQRYIAHCMKVVENFTMEYDESEFHFTLYYYDQAGNLIKTIPPAGVELLPLFSNAALNDQVIADRDNGTHNVMTKHRLATTYQYNSLNQLVSQSMPDQDVMDVFDITLPNGLVAGLNTTAIQMISENSGYLTGYIETTDAPQLSRGYLFRTENGGQNWQRVNYTLGSNLNDVMMITATTGFAAADNGLLLRTADGGVTWDLMNTYGLGVIAPFKAIDLRSTNSVFVAANNGQVVRINGAPLLAMNLQTITLPVGEGTITAVHDIKVTGSNSYLLAVTIQNGAAEYGAIISTQAGAFNAFESIRDDAYTAIDFFGTNEAFLGGVLGNTAKIVGATAGTFTQQIKASSLTGTLNKVFFLSADRGVAEVTDGASSQIAYTLNGGTTWDYLASDFVNPRLSLVEKTATKLDLVVSDNTLIGRLVLNTTGVPFIMDQTGGNALPTVFTATTALINSGQVVYYAAGTDGKLYRSTPHASGSASVSFIEVANLGATPVKKMTATLLNGGQHRLTLLSPTGQLRKVIAPASLSSYTVAVINAPTTWGANNVVDFAVVPNGTSFYLLAYDRLSNRLARLTMGSTLFAETMTAVTLNFSTLPATNTIAAIAVNTNKLTIVGAKGQIFTSTTISPAMNSLNFLERFNQRSTTVTAIQSVVGGLLAVGENGRVWKRTGATTIWEALPLNTTTDLFAVTDFQNDALIGGADAYIKLFNQTTAATSNFQSNTAMELGVALQGASVKDIETIGTQVYVVGTNGKIAYSNDAINETFAVTSVTGGHQLNAVSVIPGQTGIQQRVIIAANGSRMYRYRGVTGSETKELFGPLYSDVHFANTQMGTFVGDHYAVRTTTDGGLTWNVELPAASAVVLNNLNSLRKTWTVNNAGNHYAVIAGGGYLTSIYNHVTDPTGVAITGAPRALGFEKTSPLDGYIGIADKLYKMTLTPGSAISIALGANYTAPENIQSLHIFENQTVMLVGNDYIGYFNGTTIENATLGQTGNFRDVYFHDNYEGYVVGTNGKFLRVTSTNNSLINQQIVVNDLQYNQMTITDGIVTNANQSDIQCIAFGSRTAGIWGGKYGPAAMQALPTPNVRLIHDESGEVTARFFYDRLGRIVVSQNSRQAAQVPRKYSYTLYDELGRVFEAGEKTENASGILQFAGIFGANVNGYTVASVIDDADLENWLNQPSGARKEVTRSYYDYTNSSILAQLPTTFDPDPLTQRKRIVHVTYEEVYDANDATFDHATHYNYDIHGNVVNLLQDNAKLGQINDIADQRFKRFDYNFDLISGNVHRVSYQQAAADQWHHAYHYDADNRITEVYTSTATPLYDPVFGQATAQNEPEFSPYWNKEADYTYYAHGPLARTVLGEQEVQGLDYVYTLQGWVKGVNSNSLDPNHDPGQDGNGLSANHLVARDAMGFSLHYYDGDYVAINGNNTAYGNQDGSDMATHSYDLFNGNIGRMVTTITDPDSREALPMGNAYKYDQLNRLRESRSFTNYDASSNAWGSGQAALYYNAFTFDANGNIETQERWNAANQKIDQLQYKYKKNSADKLLRNRLYSVIDLVDPTLFTDDIDDMGFIAGNSIETANNYSYDQEGRLIKDVQEEIQSIEWRVDGKVKKIIRPSGSQKKNVSFDYDAMGNRIAKHVMNASNQLEKSTYYVLDAQGNTMAVYEREINNTASTITFTQEEKHIYGSRRLGVMNDSIPLLGSQNDTYDQSTWVHTIGKRMYELSNHLGNVLSVISDKVIPNVATGTTVDYYLADIRQSTDYSPFGVQLTGRNFTKAGAEDFRYGFNGKEATDEWSGDGNSYDFGARMYDPRLGRFLSLDPQVKKLPSTSPYSFAVNSPLMFTDYLGEFPKVAIIIGEEGDETAFDTHKAALEKAGYKVVYAKTGAEALKKMCDNSSADSPIENLILISHGSPGGLSNGKGGGIYTDPELESMVKEEFEQKKINEVAKRMGVSLDQNNPKYNPSKIEEIYKTAKAETESWWDCDMIKCEVGQAAEILKYKNANGAITPDDIANAISSKKLFIKSLTIVLGGCNTAGYPDLDGQEIFATDLAKTTSSTVFASQGFTGPVTGSTKRVSNKEKGIRDNKGRWIKTDKSGKRTNTGKSTLDMAKPQ